MVSGGPVLSPRFSSPELREKLRSPYEIVHASSTSAGLPMPVFSFPDQVVGDGGTYVLLEHEGKPRRWSSMEALLVLRHAPEVLYVSGPGAWPAFRFVPILHRGAAEAFEPVHLTALVGTLVSRLEMDLREPPDDWLARECYLLKEPAVFERRIRHELCDIEALLRIEMDEPGPENAAVGRILADVLLARKESMSGRLHQ
jgi:hypothetical protein